MRSMTFVWCCLLLMSISDAGATRYYVDGSIGTSGTGLNWGEAKKTIAEAMDAATVWDEVWVRAGTYSATTTHSLVTMKRGVSLYGGFAGTETSRTEANPVVNRTVLDGANVSWHVIYGDNFTTATISGFVIQRGRCPYVPGVNYGRGSGMYLTSCTLVTMSDCIVQSNNGRMGAAVWTSYADVTFNRCHFLNNHAYAAGTAIGGAFYANYGNLAFTDCVIAGNSAKSSAGGLYSTGSFVTMTNCVLSANTSGSSAGGASVSGYTQMYDPPQLAMKNCVISGNRATNGGGIYNVQTNVHLLDCTIDGNTATGDGGGYYAVSESAGARATMIGCIFSNNANYAIYDLMSFEPTLSCSLFYNNGLGDYAIMSISRTLMILTGAAQIDAVIGSNDRDGDPAFDTAWCAAGTWSAAPVYDNSTSTTLLACAGANLYPDALAGKLLNPNLGARPQCYITSNTADAITVAGDATALTSSGASWRVVNYSLSPGSAAIDWGVAIGGISADIIGTPRPQDIPGVGYDGAGLGCDIGAYEYVLTTSSTVWLQFTWSGTEIGTEALPFNTLDEALNGVATGGTIIIKHGSSGALAKRIMKQVRIEASGGTARLGAN